MGRFVFISHLLILTTLIYFC